MIGPIVLVLAPTIAGAIDEGGAGAFAGFLVGIGIVMALVAGAALWAARVRDHLDPEEARRLAPRPIGCGRLMDAVYDRVIR